jgi:dihydroorotate dehydrogenase
MLDETLDDFSWSPGDLIFSPPYLNAAGAMGFCLDSGSLVDLEILGGFVTNPISLSARHPAQGRRCQVFPGGFLLHTGQPNPGLRRALHRYAARWERSLLPVIVHLMVQPQENLTSMVQSLEGVEGLAGIEISLPIDADQEMVRNAASACFGKLPVIVRLPVDRALELASAALDGGAAVVSLGHPRGALPGEGDHRISGRLYGPALFPFALEVVHQLVKRNDPVIGAGGVYHLDQAALMIKVGAVAVQFDAGLWSGNFWREK